MKSVVFRPEGHYSVSEVAKRLGITRQTLDEHIRKGRLPFVVSSNGWRWIKEKDVREFLKQSRSIG